MRSYMPIIDIQWYNEVEVKSPEFDAYELFAYRGRPQGLNPPMSRLMWV